MSESDDKPLCVRFPKTMQALEIVIMDWITETPRFFINKIEENNLNTAEEIIKMLEYFEKDWLQEKSLLEVKDHLNINK